MSSSHTVFIGIGSDIGDKLHFCRDAIQRLGGTAQIKIEKISHFYETQALDGATVTEGRTFINAAIQISTQLSPTRLLHALQEIERSMGRASLRPKNSPRTIDLDILLFDSLIVDEPDLKIPHPEMHKRLFVLAPLCDIAPDVVHPSINKPLQQLMQLHVLGEQKNTVRRLNV